MVNCQFSPIALTSTPKMLLSVNLAVVGLRFAAEIYS